MNKKILLIIAVVVIVVFTTMKLPEKEGYSTSTSQNQCRDRRNSFLDNNYECVTSCFQITASMVNCLHNYADTSWDDKINEWTVGRDDDYSCYDTFWYMQKPFSNNDVAKLRCFPEIEKYADFSCSNECLPISENCVLNSNSGCTERIGGACSPYGDTDCNGIINRNELGVVAQEWMSNPTTTLRTNLGIAAQNWIDNGGI